MASATSPVRIGSDHLSSRAIRVEVKAVVQGDGRDLRDEITDRLDVTGWLSCMDVEVAGRAALPERRKQHPALEHELFPVLGGGQTGEQTLQRVQGEQLLGVAALRACQALQGEVAGTPDVTCLIGHSSTRRSSRSRGSAFGNESAILSSRDGCDPRRPSQALSASRPSSSPSRWRNR